MGEELWIRQYFEGPRSVVQFCVLPLRGLGCHPRKFSKSICERCLFLHSEWICSFPKFCWNLDEKLYWDIFLRAKCPIMWVLLWPYHVSQMLANYMISCNFVSCLKTGSGYHPRKFFKSICKIWHFPAFWIRIIKQLRYNFWLFTLHF